MDSRSLDVARIGHLRLGLEPRCIDDLRRPPLPTTLVLRRNRDPIGLEDRRNLGRRPNGELPLSPEWWRGFDERRIRPRIEQPGLDLRGRRDLRPDGTPGDQRAIIGYTRNSNSFFVSQRRAVILRRAA
jgi:hypothetical protein